MAAPSPDLQRKIDNSKKIRKERKNLDDHHRAFPEHYINSKTLDTLEYVKPWEQKHIIKPSKEKKQNKMYQSTLQEIFYAPTSPTPKVLVLCVDFSDKPASFPIYDLFLPSIESRFNLPSGLSVKKYFTDVSLGKHLPTFEIHGWYRMPQTRAYYANAEYGMGSIGINTLTTDALNLATNDPLINWCLFDNDGNYTVDYICLICAGYTAETTGNVNDLWSIAYGKTNLIPGKTCNGYTITTNLFMRSGEYSVGYNPTGVYCHEYAHMLGTKDLYDTSGSTRGAGYWSLMGNGGYLNSGNTPCNIDAYNRNRIGWTTNIINLTGYNSIQNSLISDIIYIYTSTDPNQHYIIENRQKAAWDTYIPGSGILIWHVSTICKFYPSSSYVAYLKQADGLDQLGLAKANYGDSGDSYPGLTVNRTFNRITNPNTLLCGSTTNYLGYAITNISDSASIMTFTSTADIPPCPQPTCILSVT